MRASNWIVGGAVVLLVLLVALTFDPLGFFHDDTPEPVQSDLQGGNLESGGLKGTARRPLPDADPASWEGEPVGRLVLHLGEATLEGVVTGEGNPLRFARVRPVLPPPHDALAVRTRKDGTWTITGLPDGQHELRASAEGFVGRTVVAPAVAGDRTARVEPIDLERRNAATNRIRVKVTDEFGRPLPGAKVLATTMPWDLHLAMGPEMAGVKDVIHASGTTDDTGVVELGPLHPETYSVVATAPGYVLAAVNGLVVSGNRTRSLGFILRPGVSIRGTVADQEGKGVEGAIVMGMAQPSFVSSLLVHTTADGSFVLDGLRKSKYILIAWHQEMGQAMSNGAAPGTAKLVLEGTGKVHGRVTWEDGTPVTAGQIRPFLDGWFKYVYSMVYPLHSDGTFEFALPKGSWTLRVQSDEGHMVDHGPVAIRVGEASEVDIKLPKSGTARGVVMDESGNHVEGAEVFVMKGGVPESPSREQYARTDADGRFEVHGLPLTPINLHVRHQDYQDTQIQVTASAAEKAQEISVRLAQGASVVGRVANADGGGIAGEQVNLAQTWFDAESTFTDGDGGYRFDHVTPGTYFMTTGPYEAQARGMSKQDIEVGGTGEVTVNWEVPAAAGRLAGLVRVAGAPAAGAQVTIVDDRGPEQAVHATTGEDGRFLAEGIQFGGVQVTARTARGRTGTTRARVNEGDAPSELTVDIGTCGVHARVLDAEGQPVSGCWINLETTETDAGSTWGRVKANGTSNTEGTFSADGLQPGEYQLRVNRDEFAQLVTAPFRIAEGEVKDVGDLRLRRGAVLQGIARDDAGVPVEKVTVGLRDMQGREVFLFSIATTGSDGRYALNGVEPGRYVVRFQCKGHATDEVTVDVGDEGATVNGTLTRGGTVQAVVEAAGGTPVPGARIRLIDAQGHEVTRTISMANFDSGRRYTAGNGETSLSDLAAGTYTVRCELDGWTPIGAPPRVTVEPGATAVARITMEKAP